MTLPYGVISDPHYHRWDAFATTNADGLNSRLEIQLDVTKEAAKTMKAAGCKHMLVAGDTFHVRGAILPSVLHFMTETYEWIIKELGLEVVMLPDLKPPDRFRTLGKLIAYPASIKRARELPVCESGAFFFVCYPLD